MNFEPRRILLPERGNNLDSRTSNVRVMNNRQPTSKQLTELAYRFEHHLVHVRNSLAGLITGDGRLSDGSDFRIVSNSGMHTLMLWPAGGTPPFVPLGEWFRAIPASDTLRSGTGSLPSWGWQFPKKEADLDAWPDKHKPISIRTDHPGHVTWSNPSLQVEGKPLVLKWRGPRDRYAATTGHSTATGGGIVAHERDPAGFPSSVLTLQLAEDVLKDSEYVWINGHKINTGIPKVIAACLHQYDPVNEPGQFVLRVCSDRTIASSTRQMVIYDLVPTSGADGGTLQSFAQASATLHVKATYLAADHLVNANPGGGAQTPGKWDYWQRPHFNRSGSRLATLLMMIGPNGTDRESHAVSFDATTWAIVDDVETSLVGTQFSTGGGFVVNAGWSNTQNFLIACDFEGDDFVYMELVVEQDVTRTGESFGAYAPGVLGGTQDRDETVTFTINHSVLGMLKQWTSTATYHKFYQLASAGTGLWNATADMQTDMTNTCPGLMGRSFVVPPPNIALVGDLSKKTFALGYPELGSSYTASGTLSGIYPNTSPPPLVPMTATLTRTFMVFDVYFDGVLVAAGQHGSFDKTPTDVEVGAYNEWIDDGSPGLPNKLTTNNTGGSTARYSAQSSSPVTGPPSFEGRFSTANATLRRAATYLYGAAPMHQHCAVHPEKWAAYFGAAYYQDNSGYGGTTPVPNGIELFVLGATTENPIAYITGAHPTLAVPVFMGLGADNGETT